MNTRKAGCNVFATIKNIFLSFKLKTKQQRIFTFYPLFGNWARGKNPLI